MTKRLIMSRLFDRRDVLAGLAAAALGPTSPRIAMANRRQFLRLRATAETIALGPAGSPTQVTSLQATPAGRFWRTEDIDLLLRNDLPGPVTLNIHGVDGATNAEPLARRAPVPAGTEESFMLPVRHAGTYYCDIRLLGEERRPPSRPLALVVEDGGAPPVDRDEVFLVEDWRLRADGTAIAAGADPKDTLAVYTVNGRIAPEVAVRAHQRLRFRFINGCQRSVIALKIEGHEVRVMALDGAPAEPFLARNGALVLAPGGRADADLDATAAPGSAAQILLHDGKEARPIARLVTLAEPPVRSTPLAPAPPLPSNGLPAQLDLKNAQRFDLELGGAQTDWVNPASFTASAAPALRARVGRTVVLALTNHASVVTVFHLHGHHFRLLDRLDDGWKPFWLDTLAVEPGQTQRIAFAAEYAGSWLIESMATDWAAPRFVRWYGVA
jgi:FtsP/CotA-like multicopper oxidase with cupredoxin domain